MFLWSLKKKNYGKDENTACNFAILAVILVLMLAFSTFLMIKLIEKANDGKMCFPQAYNSSINFRYQGTPLSFTKITANFTG